MKRITVGVTGGIAAYKAADVVSALRKEDFDVHVIMTAHAREFITPLTFEALSGHEVAVDTFEPSRDGNIHHITWGQEADALLIVPATANCLAKCAHGVADDMLTSTVMAATCPLIMCPSMHASMYEKSATQENITLLKQRGVCMVGPCEGRLVSGEVAAGHIAPLEEIISSVKQTLGIDQK